MNSNQKRFLELVDDLLDEWIEDKRGSGVWNLADTHEPIRASIEDAIQRGRLDLDIDGMVWAAIQRSDAARRARGQRAVSRERLRAAEGWMSLDGAAWLDVIVALGKGDRCRYGDFRTAELLRADALKKENLDRVKAAWREWEADRDAILPALAANITIEEAYTNKLITVVPDLFADQGDDDET
jgi:hypothetical protein